MDNLKIRGEWRLDQELGNGEVQGYCCERDVQGALPGDGGLRLELLLRAGGQEGHPAVLCYLLLQPSPDGGGGRHWLLLHEAGGLGHPAEWCFDMEAQKVEAGVVITKT